MTNETTQGYVFPRRTLRIVFKDTAYEGAEVVLRLSVPISTALGFKDFAGQVSEEMVASFVMATLIEWNLLDDDGNPIPATPAGLIGLGDTAFVTILMEQWAQEFGGGKVKDPLEQTSQNGDTSVELTMPMEIRSQSH